MPPEDKPNKQRTEHGEDRLLANQEHKDKGKNISNPALSGDYAPRSELSVNTSICLASQSSQETRHLKMALKEWQFTLSHAFAYADFPFQAD